MARPISAANQIGRFDALWTGRMIVYEVRYRQAKWVVTYKGAVCLASTTEKRRSRASMTSLMPARACAMT